MDQGLYRLSQEVGERLLARNWMAATAESCTGGWVAKALTDVPGSSRWFERGFVTYTNLAKQELLGVSAETLVRHGAVSEVTVREMVAGALRRSRANVVVAISGVAGPSGGTPDRPVGMVWFAWGRRASPVQADSRRFEGDREAVRRRSVHTALQGLLGIG